MGRLNTFRAQRMREYEDAGMFQGMSKENARQKRLKAVGEDWKVVKEALKEKKPVPQLKPPHIHSGTIHHSAVVQPACDEGGVGVGVPALSAPDSNVSHRRAIMSAIRAVEDTEGSIHQGHFTDESWAIMCALMGDPTSVTDALNGPDAEHWNNAILKELQSLLDLDVYEEITRNEVPKNKKILLSKIVLKYKVFEKRYKARLVVLGFMQPDEDAGDTFAPVAKFTTFRLLMAIACALDLEISASGVATAFLNAVLSEPIYIYPPRSLGFPPNTVWKLLKNLYGLKGAPRGWNATLHAFLLEIGFTQSAMDPCLYFISGLWVLVWVDDCLKVGSSEAMAWFEERCNERFSMTHTAAVEMFVGIEISRDRANRTLDLRQTGYNDKILKKYKLIDEDGKPDWGNDTPMAEGTKVSKEDCCNGDPDKKAEFDKLGFDYISAAASLLYASIVTRPDLAFVAKECCKVMSDPGPKHVPIVKRALKYLRGTRDWGIRYQANDIDALINSLKLEYIEVADLTLAAYCDASFGDDPDTRRSTQGMVAMLCNGPVSWFCQGQKSTSLSTAEAELIALADALKEVLYMREAMVFLGVPQLEPTVIYEDNQAVVATAHNPGKNHGKLKHVAIRTSRVQEEVHLQTINVIHKPTAFMLADILTKALGKVQFKKLALAILGLCKLKE